MCPPACHFTLLIMGSRPGFGKFIIQAIRISYNHSIKAAYGTLSPEGLPDRRIGEKLLPRRRKDAAHTTGDLTRRSEAGSGFTGEADRPLGERIAADRCRPDCVRLRAPLRQPGVRFG